jgi:hypothetical protein
LAGSARYEVSMASASQTVQTALEGLIWDFRGQSVRAADIVRGLTDPKRSSGAFIGLAYRP